MDCNEEENLNRETAPATTTSGSAAVNSLILDYYKKFGRKRDLEQYFSLSTAQSDVKDTSGTFWQKMKSENDSSDSGEKKSDSSQELCRISIRCSLPDPCSSQYHAKSTKPVLTGSALLESLGIKVKSLEEDSKQKSESVSPPIITEEVTQNVTQNSDDESIKSYGNNSQKSFDVLDTSANKPHSPTSSITSQRKLEWDSLADVGYGNESDRKTSGSSLSTLERLALKQQYSNNDTKLDSILEPTGHSTPMDENESKTKNKKGVGKKSTKVYKKDVDYLEVNMPHSSESNPPQTINVNLTKHISFNVEKDGKVSIENTQKDISVSPEKNTADTNLYPVVRMDKEMQTSLIKSKDPPKALQTPQKIPVLISLNTLRRQTRKKKLRMARKKLKSKKKPDKENIIVQEKSGEQLSEAESFEYMPGHMYNQNQLTANDRSGNTAGNKSSLESSGLLTTDSSKGSKHSFTKDLEKSIDILRAALQRGDDANLRKQLIKQVCERLLKSKYRDDESSTDFLSGLSFSSKKLGLGKGNTTSSTSDNSGDKSKRPKKSILRSYKFNAGALASTSQSAPNLPTTTNSEKLVSSKLTKNLTTSNTDSDLSPKEKSSSDNVFAKTSSQELYQRYLDALKREEAYKQHLKDKELFLKQKLVCSDSAIRAPTRSDPILNNKLKDLIKDLTRNNYDDGSGDASKLEGGPNSSRDLDRFLPSRSQRSHSVFTLSSCGNSEQNKKQNLKKRLQIDISDLAKPGTSREHNCCCTHHSPKSKACVIDSSVQVNIERPCDSSSCERRHPSPTQVEQGKTPSCMPKMVADEVSGDIKYVCLCNNKTIQDVPDDFMIFKCSRLAKNNQEALSKSSHSPCRTRNVTPRKNKDMPCVPTIVQCPRRKNSPERICEMKTTSKSSQTNFLLKMIGQRSSDCSPPCNSNSCSRRQSYVKPSPVDSTVFEATRWLQTEISINPRIPEPSLSDINIVTECADLVGEPSRKIRKPSITDVFSRQQNTGTSCNSGSSKSSGTSKEIGEFFYDDDIFVKAKTFEAKETVESGSDRSEKFKIPIQGTNMTLMVSIGSGERKNKPEDIMVGQCIGTERNNVAEQGTSVAEECSKGVQYDTSRPSSRKTDHNSNNVEIIEDCNKNPYTVNTCLTAQDPTFNTFPKISPVNEQRPFRRANTDTDNFAGLSVPLHLDNKFAETQEEKSGKRYKCNEKVKPNQCEMVSHTGLPIGKTASVEKETQYSEPNSPKCVERKKSSSSQCSSTNDISKSEERVQTLLTKSVKCQCGCSGYVNNCYDECIERSSTIDKSNVIRSGDERKKSLTVQNIKKPEHSFCSCGCGGDKDKCNKNCEVSKKCISTQCSCGCSGDKDKCNKDCREVKKCLTKDDNLASPKCSCGCNGDIENCKENCDKCKKSLSTQCSCGCSGDKAKCKVNCEECHVKILKEIGIQKDSSSPCSQTPSVTNIQKPKTSDKKKQNDCGVPSTSKNSCEINSDKPSDKCKTSESETEKEGDPILEMIQNITKKYSKNDIEKGKKKKCFKDIITVLNYLLETEDSTDRTDGHVTSESNTTPCEKPEKKSPVAKKTDKPSKAKKPIITESSDCPLSTDIPGTSSDSATCKVLNKIKKECERYHQKRCKAHSGKKCDISSSTSANCEQCRRVHHCACRNHKCKAYKKCEKIQKKAVAYNLVLQTTESISEETVCNDQRPLKNIVVKVPSQKNKCCNVPFKEMSAKIESKMPHCNPHQTKPCRSKSLPNESEISSMEEFLRKSQACCTVREYLEQNRPDFIAKTSQRQDCLRIVSDTRNEDPCCKSPQLKMIVFHKPNCVGACNAMYQYQGAAMRAAQRDLLSVRLAQLSDVNDLDPEELRKLAADLGRHMRQKQPAPKFISERAMKKHSENIYKSLPEVVQKKEEARKESIKKTNLLMAHIFNKNLQKKTLRGSVDISNYSQILKI